MATLNPFDLLDVDAEDPSQIVVALPKKVEKTATPVLPAKNTKLQSKQAPPSQSVRESRNAPSGARGGAGGRGPARGPFNPGGNSPYDPQDGPKDGERNGGFRGYRESGGRGGNVGGFANGKTGDVERPKRVYDRRSGTGRSNDLKREGGGRRNWGTPEDDIPPPTEEPTTEVEKAEKEGGEADTITDEKKEAPADEQEEKEPEDKEMTLEEYEKILEEKKKALQQATKVEERKVDTKVFESMQQLSNKKTNNEEIFIKLGSEKDKRKDAAEKEEKAKKSLSINEFLKPADGGRYNPRGGYRGRGGRNGGRGQRDGGGRGQRDGGNQRHGGTPAPAIGDSAQFPSLGK
ncbi:RGG repeats nuclear RNA binding protein C [Hirschfeldia incana]|nr:RGG repeats nuclear RNA binding protein C [Hirschfeldia incana]KAJ0240595.1 RGG repeats nuclear RNA binding protein C [Hirschfeldia incana]